MRPNKRFLAALVLGAAVLFFIVGQRVYDGDGSHELLPIGGDSGRPAAQGYVDPPTPAPPTAYPAPLEATPKPEPTWSAADMQELGDRAVNGLGGAPWAEGPFDLVKIVDIYPEDGPAAGVTTEMVELHGFPDYAIVVGGSFFGDNGQKYDYVMAVFDRGYGLRTRAFSNDVQELLDRLPE